MAVLGSSSVATPVNPANGTAPVTPRCSQLSVATLGRDCAVRMYSVPLAHAIDDRICGLQHRHTHAG